MTDIDGFKFEDFELEGYAPHKAIKMQVGAQLGSGVLHNSILLLGREGYVAQQGIQMQVSKVCWGLQCCVATSLPVHGAGTLCVPNWRQVRHQSLRLSMLLHRMYPLRAGDFADMSTWAGTPAHAASPV